MPLTPIQQQELTQQVLELIGRFRAEIVETSQDEQEAPIALVDTSQHRSLAALANHMSNISNASHGIDSWHTVISSRTSEEQFTLTLWDPDAILNSRASNNAAIETYKQELEKINGERKKMLAPLHEALKKLPGVELDQLPNINKDEYLCPVSGDLMVDPVTLPEDRKRAYERCFVMRIIDPITKKITSPLTRRKFTVDDLADASEFELTKAIQADLKYIEHTARYRALPFVTQVLGPRILHDFQQQYSHSPTTPALVRKSDKCITRAP